MTDTDQHRIFIEQRTQALNTQLRVANDQIVELEALLDELKQMCKPVASELSTAIEVRIARADNSALLEHDARVKRATLNHVLETISATIDDRSGGVDYEHALQDMHARVYTLRELVK